MSLYVPPTGSTDPNASYVGKSVAAGTQGSRVPPGAVEYPQREIAAIIAAAYLAGLPAPTNADLAQMLKAVRSGLLNRFTATGTPDAIAIAPQPAYVGLVEGMRFRIKIPGAGSNTTTTPALGVNSLTAPIRRRDGSAPASGDLVAGLVVEFEIDGALNARIAGSVGTAAPRLRITQNVPGIYTYTPTANGILVGRCRGPGGGGGGANGSSGAGAGGGGGGYDECIVPLVAGVPVTYVVGAGGVAGVAGPTSTSQSGGTGGTSSIGSAATATGGTGGLPGIGYASLSSGQPGSGSGPNGRSGTVGGYGQAYQGGALGGGFGGAGAKGGCQSGPAIGGVGLPGNGPGGGGTGAGGVNGAGGAGAPGDVELEIY